MYILLKQRLGNNGCEVRHRSKKDEEEKNISPRKFYLQPIKMVEGDIVSCPLCGSL